MPRGWGDNTRRDVGPKDKLFVVRPVEKEKELKEKIQRKAEAKERLNRIAKKQSLLKRIEARLWKSTKKFVTLIIPTGTRTVKGF